MDRRKSTRLSTRVSGENKATTINMVESDNSDDSRLSLAENIEKDAKRRKLTMTDMDSSSDYLDLQHPPSMADFLGELEMLQEARLKQLAGFDSEDLEAWKQFAILKWGALVGKAQVEGK